MECDSGRFTKPCEPIYFADSSWACSILTLAIPAEEISAWAQSSDAPSVKSKDKQPPQPEPQTRTRILHFRHRACGERGRRGHRQQRELFDGPQEGEFSDHRRRRSRKRSRILPPPNAPITIVLLLEFSRLGYQIFTYNARNWSAAFLDNLKPNDWVALETFNMRPNIEVDFTHNRNEIMQGLYQLVFPPFSESNLFDALADVLDRIKDVKGKKAVLVLASGMDTFSKMNLDQIMKRIRETDATIFTVGVGEQLFLQADATGSLGPVGQLNFLQAENQMKTFAAMTGGRAWFPRFDGEIPSIMQDVAASLRNQYSMAYSPSNTALDGKYRKIKVELVAPDGGPLTVTRPEGQEGEIPGLRAPGLHRAKIQRRHAVICKNERSAARFKFNGPSRHPANREDLLHRSNPNFNFIISRLSCSLLLLGFLAGLSVNYFRYDLRSYSLLIHFLDPNASARLCAGKLIQWRHGRSRFP